MYVANLLKTIGILMCKESNMNIIMNS